MAFVADTVLGAVVGALFMGGVAAAVAGLREWKRHKQRLERHPRQD